MTGTIIVGVDGSNTARKAAESARNLDLALNAPLLVVSAFDSDRTEVYGSGGDKWIISAAGDAERRPKVLQTTFRSGDLAVSHSVVRGKPADALLKEAARVEAA